MVIRLIVNDTKNYSNATVGLANSKETLYVMPSKLRKIAWAQNRTLEQMEHISKKKMELDQSWLNDQVVTTNIVPSRSKILLLPTNLPILYLQYINSNHSLYSGSDTA